jgi:hypothetical protein
LDTKGLTYFAESLFFFTHPVLKKQTMRLRNQFNGHKSTDIGHADLPGISITNISLGALTKSAQGACGAFGAGWVVLNNSA